MNDFRIRRFKMVIFCASCKSKIEKVFSDYPEIKFSVNLIDEILLINADPNKYPDNFIVEKLKNIGYEIEKI